MRQLKNVRKLPISKEARSCGEQGSAAVEFALVAPVLFLLYAGFTEFPHYVYTYMNLIRVAETMAELTSRQSTLTDSAMGKICTFAKPVFAPYDATGLTIKVADMKPGTSTVIWNAGMASKGGSCTSGNGLTSTSIVPANITAQSSIATTSVIAAQAQFTYKILFPLWTGFRTTMVANEFVVPRNGAPSQYN